MLTDIEIIALVSVILGVGFMLEYMVRRIIGFAISELIKGFDELAMHIASPEKVAFKRDI